MPNIEGPKDTVQRIKFKPEQKDKLREYLRKELSNTEGERSRLLEKCKLWAQQAASRRQRKGVKSRESNIDMPLTRQMMMQNSARLLNPIFQQDVLFIANPRNPVWSCEDPVHPRNGTSQALEGVDRQSQRGHWSD
jgi:hypothetical protein